MAAVSEKRKIRGAAQVPPPNLHDTQRPAALDTVALRAIYIMATRGPWAIESCGEKGDGSNMIGVVFGPDDPDCKNPIAGWLPEWDGEGEEPRDFFRDEEVAECAHRNPNCHRDAVFITTAYNNFPALLDAVDALAGLVGLTQLLLGRDDLPAQVREALESNHRVVTAREVLAEQTQAPASRYEVNTTS